MGHPLLVVVSGPPGSGTTTLAHKLARAIPCPAVCRDEIKEGLLQGVPDYVPAPGDAEAHRTLEIFFGVVGYLVDAGVSLVAESAFQHALWEQGAVEVTNLSGLLDTEHTFVLERMFGHGRIPRHPWFRAPRRASRAA